MESLADVKTQNGLHAYILLYTSDMNLQTHSAEEVGKPDKIKVQLSQL